VLTRLLAHPATKGLDLDAPETTTLRRDIVLSKPFLRAVYEEWYQLIIDRLPEGGGDVLEIGAGSGFFGDFFPDAITSDVFPVDGVDRVIDARELPFADSSLRAIVMTNTLHHIPDVGRFLAEAERCLRPSGRIIAIEPWNTRWSQLVHERFHTEPWRPDAEDWSFPESGPLSGANAPLAWIVTVRDRDRLAGDFPDLIVVETTPFMPFRYLASGGVSLRSLQPGWMYGAWKRLDELGPLRRRFAVFAVVVLERVDT